MKAKIMLVSVLTALSTFGSSCIREGFLIPVNLTIDQCYPLNAGPAGSFSAIYTIPLTSLLDETFRGNIKAVRFYDIKVSTVGSYTGTVVAHLYLSNTKLLDIGQGANNATPIPWPTLLTPQSLLGSSPYVHASPSGVTVLVNQLNSLINDESASVTLQATWTTAGANVPSGLSICFQILAQADAELNASGDGVAP